MLVQYLPFQRSQRFAHVFDELANVYEILDHGTLKNEYKELCNKRPKETTIEDENELVKNDMAKGELLKQEVD